MEDFLEEVVCGGPWKVKGLSGAEIRVEGKGALSDLSRRLRAAKTAVKWIASGRCRVGVRYPCVGARAEARGGNDTGGCSSVSSGAKSEDGQL